MAIGMTNCDLCKSWISREEVATHNCKNNTQKENKMQLQNVAYPIGLKITNIRMMTKLELEAEGWEESYGGFPVVIELEDGGKLYASSDPEGNDSGCIFGMTEKGEAIIISPLTQEMIDEGRKA
jgi:hypothetical protein